MCALEIKYTLKKKYKKLFCQLLRTTVPAPLPAHKAGPVCVCVCVSVCNTYVRTCKT